MPKAPGYTDKYTVHNISEASLYYHVSSLTKKFVIKNQGLSWGRAHVPQVTLRGVQWGMWKEKQL